MRILSKIIIFILSLTVSLSLGILLYFNIPVGSYDQKAELGITFSWRYAGEIGLSWEEAYLAVLDDLGARKIRIPVYWDSVEEKEGEYDFSKVDWQVAEAGKRGAKVILVVGQKVPRWPECFIPNWIGGDKNRREEALLRIIEKTVERYRGNETVSYWQVENEPFLRFGNCPDFDKEFLDREIALVREMDDKEIMVTDSGELSLWIQAARRADVFGTTMYREVVSSKWGRWKYPIGPRFFHFKKRLVEEFVGQKEIQVVELQAEPWISGWTTAAPLSEQFSSMDERKLRDNVEFAKKSGFSDIYLWGAEWWYWLKIEKDHPELWEEAKQLFAGSR